MHIFYRYTIHVSLMFFMTMVASGAAMAGVKQAADAIVYTDGSVYYCDAYSMVPLEKIKKLLADGAVVSASWQFKITRQRNYWLDQSVASKEIIRQVTPDLIASRWMLLNVTTGVVKTTRSLQHALQFLLNIEHIPLISLEDITQWKADGYLQEKYAIHVRLHISDGIITPTGWRTWLRLGKTVAIHSLTLP